MRIRIQFGFIAAVVAGLSLFFACSRRAPEAEINFTTALAALTNIESLAAVPIGEPHLLSTCDRSGGNADWGNIAEMKKQDGLVVIADLKGPGCLKRFWQTNIPAERWFFFFDGERTPRLNVASSELFDGKGPFPMPLTGDPSGGGYSYLPLPFRKSLRIAFSINKGQSADRPYFQVNYDTYPAGTDVESFPQTLSVSDRTLMKQVNEVWQRTEETAQRETAECGERHAVALAPGETATWLSHDGAAMLAAFWLNLTPSNAISVLDGNRLLRQVSMRMYWDGARQPSVDVPFGDFFCNGFHRRSFSSLALACLDDATYVCRFPMPFRKSARVEFVNGSDSPVTIQGGWRIAPLPVGREKDVNYFHACWNSIVSAGAPARVLRAEGRGHMVGCYLIAIGMDGSWNMLEGDDMISLNGEATPSLWGTGLEDYFNGGWYYYSLFHTPLSGLIEKAAMQTMQYRLQIPDAVRFDNGMYFSWQVGGGSVQRASGYVSSVAWWYQPEPHPAPPLPEPEKRFPPPNPLERTAIMSGLFELERIGQNLEAENMALEYAEKFAQFPDAPILRLRAVAYRELTDGFAAVRQKYEAMAQSAPESVAGRQALTLLWFHQAETNALLAAHADMAVRLYLDGSFVGEGQNPYNLFVFPVTVLPGKHEIEAEVKPMCPGPWVSFHLRTRTTNIVSDATWECSRQRPANWPRTDDSGILWTNVIYGGGSFPKMAWWQFMPNGFVGMQSGNRLIESAWDGWDKQPYATTYLRKKFIVPAAASPK